MRRLVPRGAFAVLALGGCAAIEDKLHSSSDSSGSDSGSRSLGSGAGVHASASYRQDVESYAVACLDRDEAPGDLLRGVSRIAELHGISDWQAAPATVTALRAVVSGNRLDAARIARLRVELAPLGPAVLSSTFADGTDNEPARRTAR